MVDYARFHRFARFDKNTVIDILYNERLREILNMINPGEDKKSIVLDLGCGKGHFSRVLSLQSIAIGLDMNKRVMVEAQVKGRTNRLHFVVADISSLPFRGHSIDVVVCASVLEHIQDLNVVMKQMRHVLKKDGILVAGYPIEAEFFKLIWRLVSPRKFKLIDPPKTSWVTPYTHKRECYWKCPATHKQDYQAIRDALRKYFRILRTKKLPFNVLSDSFSYYECMKCTPA